MKILFFFLFIAAVAVESCDNNPSQSTKTTAIADTSKAAENKIMIPASTCYSYASARDTIFLKVEIFPNVVTGNLSYKLYQKDSSKGELEGKLYGDSLIADYKFMSEGKQSIRQVIFLIKDGVATEGYGDMEEKNGKMIFKNRKEVTFSKDLVLKKIPCGEN